MTRGRVSETRQEHLLPLGYGRGWRRWHLGNILADISPARGRHFGGISDLGGISAVARLRVVDIDAEFRERGHELVCIKRAVAVRITAGGRLC